MPNDVIDFALIVVIIAFVIIAFVIIAISTVTRDTK